jgi:hypothetical protein
MEGTEKTTVPEAVITALLEQFKAIGINPVAQPEQVTYLLVRQLLQKIHYSHMFENATQIIRIVAKKPIPTLTRRQKSTLTQCFKEVQGPFEKYKDRRKNFISYSYIMYKFCEMLGYTYWLDYLKLFETDIHLVRADQVWKKICAECGYEYVETDVITNKIRSRQLSKRQQRQLDLEYARRHHSNNNKNNNNQKHHQENDTENDDEKNGHEDEHEDDDEEGETTS